MKVAKTNKIFRIFILLFGLIVFSKQAFSETDYFKEAKEAFNANNFSKALTFIIQADKAKPNTNYIQFWHALILYNNKKYSESASIFEKLDFNYYTISTHWYIADSYLKLNKPEKTLQVLEKILPPALEASAEIKDCYGLYVQALIALDSKDKLFNLDKALVTYYESFDNEAKNYQYYLLAKYYLKYSKELCARDNVKESQSLYVKAINLYKLSSTEYKTYYNFYELTELLKSKNNYAEALTYFELLPNDFFSSYDRVWYYAEALENTENYTKAKKVLLSALQFPKEEKPYWKNYIYNKIASNCAHTKDYETMRPILGELLAYFSSTDDNVYEQTRYYIIDLLEKEFYTAMYAHESNKIKEIYTNLQKVANLKTKNTKPKESDYLSQFTVLAEAGNFYANNYLSLQKSAYKHKILLAPFKYVDATWKDKDGKIQTKKNTFNEKEVEDYKQLMDIFNQMLFYLSKGSILAEYTIELQESTITNFEYTLWKSAKTSNGKSLQEVDILSPDLFTTKPFSLSLFSNSINDYDTVAIVFPSEGITNICTGSKTNLPFVPYLLNSTASRGKIIMASESMDPLVFLHEFFHTVEGTYTNDFAFTMHAYKNDFVSYWPTWYKGEGELPYYKAAFNTIIKPLGFDKLHYRESKDSTTDTLLKIKLKDYQTSNYEKIKKAYELQTEAWEIYTQNQEKALPKFLESFALYQKNEKVCEVIGYLYYIKGDYKNSLKYYLLHETVLKEANMQIDKSIIETIAWLKTKV